MKNLFQYITPVAAVLALSACGGSSDSGPTHNSQLPLMGSNSGSSGKQYAVEKPDSDARISAGYNHAVGVSTDGNVYAWGRNDSGQLGNNSKVNSDMPVQVLGVSNMKAVRTGYAHSLALNENGVVYAWGANNVGQLGLGRVTGPQGRPIQVPGITDVTSLAAGHSHSVALVRNGTVWGWGSLPTSSSAIPVQIPGLSNVKSVVAGGSHALALLKDGTVWAWGANSKGQLGATNFTGSAQPVYGLSNVKAIAAGLTHSLALTMSGEVYALGGNEYYQLGRQGTSYSLPTLVQGLTKVKSISAGAYNSVAVLENGSVYSWGNNLYGQYGNASYYSTYVPTAMLGAGGNVAAVSSGAGFTTILLADGSVYGTGLNAFGQLGNRTNLNAVLPMQTVGVNGRGYLNLGVTPK